jgi:DNA polymerase III epsilon subunit family exonuclease
MTNTLLQQFNKQTENQFDFLRLSQVNFGIREKCAEYIFLYPEKEQKQVTEKSGLIRGALQKVIAGVMDTTITLRASHFDENLFVSQLFDILKLYPSIAPFVNKGNIVIASKSEQSILVTIALQSEIEQYANSVNLVGTLKQKLYFLYTQEFDIKLKSIELSDTEKKQIEQSRLAKSSVHQIFLEDEQRGRSISVTDLNILIGKQIEQDAMYIADSKVPLSNAILCGTLVQWDSLTSKNDRKFFKFELQDFTGVIKGVLFGSEKTMEQVQKLKKGDTVAMRGNVELDTFNGGGAVQFMPKDISFCKMPTDFKLNRARMQVPEYYQNIFPIQFVEIFQDNFLMDNVKLLHKDIMDTEYVVFDFETTGLDEKQNTIIEIGAVKIKEGKLIQTFETLIDPRTALTQPIIEITGLTDDMLNGKPLLNDVLPDFFKFCDKCTLVAHNIDFDNKFLQHHAKNINIYFDHAKLDTLNIAKSKVKGVKNYKLETLCQKFGIVNSQAHRALSDAISTAKLFLAMHQQS